MTAKNSKYNFGYLNKLVHEYKNTYHHSVCKKLLMLIILVSLNFLSKVYTKNLLREIFVITYVLKTNHGNVKFKIVAEIK